MGRTRKQKRASHNIQLMYKTIWGLRKTTGWGFQHEIGKWIYLKGQLHYSCIYSLRSKKKKWFITFLKVLAVKKIISHILLLVVNIQPSLCGLPVFKLLLTRNHIWFQSLPFRKIQCLIWLFFFVFSFLKAQALLI